jgi:hypothetical protein
MIIRIYSTVIVILSISVLFPEFKNKKTEKARKKGEAQRISFLNNGFFKFK